jgi:DNA repair protein RadC
MAAERGVGPVRAAALAASFGLGRRLAEAALRPGTPVHDGSDVARLVRDTARGSRRESFYLVLLDVRHRVMAVHVVSMGSIESAPVHPREVFSLAIRDGAVAVVVAHNHPSGDPAPSAEDRAVTDRLHAAGRLLGVEVLDHLVVGAARYYSFAAEAYFPVR